MPPLDPEELQTIRQALGLDRAARPYRNHHVAPADDPLAARLVRRGLLRPGPVTPAGLVLFEVTVPGARLAGSSLAELEPPR